jgi:hypothetical protein
LQLDGVRQMAKVVIADLGNTVGARGKKAPVRKRRMRGPDGTVRQVMILDLTSATFDDDLTCIFEKNVAKARRENRILLGSADGVKAEEHKRRTSGG